MFAIRSVIKSTAREVRNMSIYHSSLKLNHTCLRVKDPKVSVPFYEKNFGMTLLKQVDFAEAKFSLYMLAVDEPGLPDYKKPWPTREGVLELTHNWGTETDPDYKINNGNVDPHRGFGHICFSVDNIEAFSTQLESAGVKFQKKLTDGRQKDIAFALDPDGYWVELIENGLDKAANTTDTAKNRFNHTMIRVKDPKASLEFYKDVLGMKLFSTSVHENAKFTLYFLGYEHDPAVESLSKDEQKTRQSVLELTHNWGTESDPEFKGYHTGNTAPQGYGHIGLSVDDAEKFCSDLESKFGDQLNWRLKYNAGKMKDIAFISDPDGYSIEILPSNF